MMKRLLFSVIVCSLACPGSTQTRSPESAGDGLAAAAKDSGKIISAAPSPGALRRFSVAHGKDTPVAIGVLYDASLEGSQVDGDAFRRQVLNGIGRVLGREDEAFVVNEHSMLGTDFTNNFNCVESGMLGLTEVWSEGMPDGLFVALPRSARHLRMHEGTGPSIRRVLIMIYGGGHSYPQSAFLEAVGKLLGETRPDQYPAIYAIGIGRVGQGRRDNFQMLARSTGGMGFFPTNYSELKNAFEAIRLDIHGKQFESMRVHPLLGRELSQSACASNSW